MSTKMYLTVDDIQKRGWLVKQGRFIKNWKKRFFVLKNGALFYYASPEDVVSIGQMSLYRASCVFVDLGGGSNEEHTLSVSTAERTLYLQSPTNSRDELDEWAVEIQKSAMVESGAKLRVPDTEATTTTTNTTTSTKSPDSASSTGSITNSTTNGSNSSTD